MKKIDISWRGWNLDIDPGSWFIIYTPFGQIGIDHHRRVTDGGFSRGRCTERELRIPLTKCWQIHLATKGKDYLTLVDGPKYLRNTNWLIDEFDASFNDLAISSLRYHLDWSVCDNSDQREKYEDLISRLGEPSPRLTDEEHAILRARGHYALLNDTTDEERAIFDKIREMDDAYDKRIDQARHDFVDIMRGLWS